ncbi:MAG TPA: PQQ-binding-like beta-propeller repeat protein [Pyrinomonadaceae bacterium]|nr:PQQ-binding-like beta-propeller repeat protein [Pyrinomonadaceae bacterium]
MITQAFVVARARLFLPALALLAALSSLASAAPAWEAKLDGDVRFYQQTELGVLIAGTDRSLYAIDGETGETLWRRKGARFDEGDVAAVPGTDFLLAAYERGDRSQLEAVDVLTGATLWRSERVRGAVTQMAVDADAGLLAVVTLRGAKDRARSGFKRKPTVHVLELAMGRELWEHKLGSEIELMPSEWRGEDSDEKVAYTLNNYRPPAFLDGRLYLFYEGTTSLDARTGRERQREKFRVNEEGLALTEADAVVGEGYVFTSGRGRVRAVSRANGEEVWEAKDLGVTPEMMLVGNVLYVRTGGQFVRLKDGELEGRGPYGVSAIDAATGKTLWRYKGADKGITNLALPDPDTVLAADRDDLIFIDGRTGKRRTKVSHKIERAAFLVINERGEAVVGGRDEIAGFDARAGRELWRARHDPPGRGLLRTVGAIAARAASLYFRYGGLASTAFRGAQIARAATSLRWSGLAAQVTMPDLGALASSAARDYARNRFAPIGLAAQVRARAGAFNDARATIQRGVRPDIRIPRPDIDVEERLLDRLDPSRQLEKLSRYLWRRQRLAALRGEWMYFYTDLQRGGRGLAGVNVNTGATERAVRLPDPDARFVSDEVFQLLYTAKGGRLYAYSLNGRG